MNQRSVDNLAYWTGGYDKGSTFVATEILEGEALYNELLAEVNAIAWGAGLGQYKVSGDLAAYAGNEAALIAMIESEYGAKANYVEGAEALQAMKDAAALNLPTAGFYRIKGKTSGKYLAAGMASNNKFAMSDAIDATTIFYFDGSKLMNYGSGMSNGMSSSAWAWVTEDNASAVEFQDGLTDGGYAIKSANANFYDNGDNSSSADRGGNLTIKGANPRYTSWALEEVTTLPVNVSAAGYATLYSPVALTVPSSVEAYVGKVNGNYLVMNAIAAIPAQTGVVLKAAEGTYDFAVAESATAAESDLQGSVGGLAVTNALTLQNIDEVGFYGYTGATLAGFKAYLPNSAGVKGLTLSFGDETAVQGISTELPTSRVIYSLAGQRVQKAQKGIYVVNGKKVVIK